MKILLIVFVIAGCGYIGYGVSKYFRKRRSFFLCFSMFLDKIVADISFSQSKLNQVFEANLQSHDQTLKVISMNFIKYLSNKEVQLTKDMLFENTNIFKIEEKDMLFSFFASLGKHDTNGERIMIGSHKEQVKAFANSSEIEDKKYSSLCVKVGILVGSMIALIII